MSDSFFRLGPDGVLCAVEAAGFRPTGHCTPLVCLENRVYDVRLEDGSHVVIKFYRPGRWSREAIEEEHGFLEDLRRAEVPVCAPLALAGDRTLAEQGDGLFHAIWPRVGGRAPDELGEEEIEVLGRLLARMHNVGATRESRHRPRLDAGSRIEEPLQVLDPFLPPSCARRFRTAAEALGRCYTERARGVPVHRIHGDCHRGNLLRGPEGWFLLDFDDFGVGPAVQDLWMLLPGRDAEATRQRRLLLEAYRQFRDFEEGWLRLVEPLRGLRFVWYAAWIARRHLDPVFPDAFPHFGSEAYWERETRDLEEQLARIDAEPAGGQAAELAPELTNEDLFWDL